jgi:hypothetical protein
MKMYEMTDRIQNKSLEEVHGTTRLYRQKIKYGK